MENADNNMKGIQLCFQTPRQKIFFQGGQLYSGRNFKEQAGREIKAGYLHFYNPGNFGTLGKKNERLSVNSNDAIQ